MGTVVCNVAKGRMIEYYNRVKQNDPAGCAIQIELRRGVTADANLQDINVLVTAQTSFGVIELGATTNYARKVLLAADLAAFPAPNDTNDSYEIVLPSVTWAAMGTPPFDVTRAVVCYAPDKTLSQSSWIPLVWVDFNTPANSGSDVRVDFSSVFLRES